MKGAYEAFDWNLNAESISEKSKSAIESTRKAVDQLASIQPENVSYTSFFLPYIQVLENYSAKDSHLSFFQHMSTNEDIRKASVEANEILSQFSIELSMREDIYSRMLAFQKQKPTLTPEESRFLSREIRDFRRQGLDLPQEKRDQLKLIQEKISKLEIEYSKNINEDTTTLLMTRDDLKGMPDDFFDSMTQDEAGKYKVTLQYPHVYPILKTCTVADTRKTMEFHYNSKCIKENSPILDQLILLRHQMAQLLGFSTFSDYIKEVKMAKTSENVKQFLEGLAAKLKPLYENERKVLLEFKARDSPVAKDLDPWDYSYYLEKVEKENYGIDNEFIKQYFPVEHVVKSVLDIYQKLLGLVFTQVSDFQKWHSDVSLYGVFDSKTKELYGHFYLDLHPRPGKYGHAAVFPLKNGYCKDGNRFPGLVAMLCNFTKSTPKKPALLLHSEVVTFFHEFGHVMHALCSSPSMSYFTGFNVEGDFVEAPSQMLENWGYQSESLKLLSSHYDTHQPLPDSIIDKIQKSERANVAYYMLRQIVMSLFDHRIHSVDKIDTAKEYSLLSMKLLQRKTTPGTNFAANFGHMAGGYAANYYGYCWSQVYAEDMFFSRFLKEGPLSAKVGLEYREKILKPGSTKDAFDLLKDFLGRPPSDEGFLRKLNLKH